MPYQIHWEPRGVHRLYSGNVSIAERRASLEAICRDPRFDRLLYSITDYLAVDGYEDSVAATQEIAALHIGPLMTNPRIVIAAVAIRQDILDAISCFTSLGFTSCPYQVFATPAEARAWIRTQTEGDVWPSAGRAARRATAA